MEALSSPYGWKVRSARPDRLTVADGRTALVVDAVAQGRRGTVVGAVRDQAVRLLTRPPVGFHVREAKLTRHEDDRHTVLVRVVRTAPPNGSRFSRWLWRYWQAMGGADTGHVLTVPSAPDEDGEQLKARVREQWAELTHEGATFDETRYALHLSVVPEGARRRLHASDGLLPSNRCPGLETEDSTHPCKNLAKGCGHGIAGISASPELPAWRPTVTPTPLPGLGRRVKRPVADDGGRDRAEPKISARAMASAT